MGEQEDAPATRLGGEPAAAAADEQVTELRLVQERLVRQPLHGPPTGVEPGLAHVGDPVHPGRGVRPGVDVHHLLELVEEGVVPGLDQGHELRRVGARVHARRV